MTKVDVIFRKDKSGVFALFPHDVCDFNGHVTSYQHIGQHSSGDYKHCISNSKKATELEYNDLKTELESIGYELTIVHKQNYNKFLAAYNETRASIKKHFPLTIHI